MPALKSGAYEQIHWTAVPMGDLTLTVATDCLRAPVGDTTYRLTVGWPATIEACTDLCRSPASIRICT